MDDRDGHVVKELGRKARKRLEEERSKRREIVRLDNEGLISPEREGEVHTPALPMKAPVVNRKRVRSGRTTRDEDASRNADSWMPDTSNVVSLSEYERSTVVRIYGLPKGTTPEMLRKFFLGLTAERIFVLPSLDSRIETWDAKEDNQQSPTVPRLSERCRIFVKFDSHPVAELAAKRTGELLHVNDYQDSGVALCVQQVPRKISNYLLDQMAIDAVSGRTLEELLAAVERELEPSVARLLWAMAIRDLLLSVAGEPLNSASSVWSNDSSQWDPHELAGYQKLAQQHNLLSDELERIQASLIRSSFCQRVEEDDSSTRSAVTRLTRAAANRLVSEIKNLDETCHRARVERREKLASMTSPDSFT